MANSLKRFTTYMRCNWERVLFGLVGAACLFLCFRFLLAGNIAAGSALFAMSFFSFFYSNLARFKKFRGLGFEAELWEDKQKEAADLINRLKGIVSAYTREIVMGNVMRGRGGGGGDQWTGRWALFDELTGKHTELGQDIDFSQLKSDVDSVFIFDICSPLANSVRLTIDKGKADVNEQLYQKYGPTITDINGWNADLAKLHGINSTFSDLFELAKNENIAQIILNAANAAQTKLDSSFSISLEFDAGAMERLRSMVEIIERRPITVTSQLIEWSNREYELQL